MAAREHPIVFSESRWEIGNLSPVIQAESSDTKKTAAGAKATRVSLIGITPADQL
jgi:hypothetical protein